MKATKSEAKKEIQRLVEKYERVKTIRQLKQYDEANTRKDFIMPFFHALGWDVYSHFIDQEVVEEEEAVTGRVDYSFRINNIPQFLLEAKALSVNLDKAEWAKQSLTYGWNKGIPWVILTNFEKLKLFNSEWLQEIPRPNLEFTYDEYLKRIDDLWLFSKQSIETGELNQQASKWGIKAKRLRVSEKLAADLLKWRELLRKYFKQYNPKIDDSDIDESVQRVLDRLIFIRVCEDRQLEPPILWPALQRWIAHNRKPENFMKALRPIFQDFDQKYNSNLFLGHLCERLDTDGTPFEKIINDLYADKEKGVKYNFSAIGADILGAIYEQYLGFVQLKGQINGAKRKKQGIYYTPSYIVDYIVQNTLGKVLKEKSLTEIENLKILDPACGSGSFLIKAFDLFDRTLVKRRSQEKFGPKAAFRKYNILRNNIYGVDLDQQAIEIARLNLLLKALEPKHKLPLLNNVRVGNSLISGSEKKLREHFGKRWKIEKPFNWKKELPGVFKRGGFDVTIGNPPYVTTKYGKLSNEEKSYLKENYSTAYDKFDLYTFFLEKAVILLKDGGFLGFITPWNYLNNFYSFKLRKFILETCKIVKIAKTSPGVFQEAIVDTAVSVLQKCANEKERNLNIVSFEEISTNGDILSKREIEQSQFVENKNNVFDVQIDVISRRLYKKFAKYSQPLGELVTNYIGIMTGGNEKRVSNTSKFRRSEKILTGRDIGRYYSKYANKWVDFNPAILHSNTNERIFLTSPKILLRKTGDSLAATLDNEKFFTLQSLYNIVLKKQISKYDLRYILAILNSKLQTFIYRKIFITNPKVYPYIKRRHLDQLPIYKIDFSKKTEKERHDELVRLADKTLKLNRDLQKCAKDSDKYRAIQVEIERVDKKIDHLVYKLYNLTPEEIKIVEK